MKFGIVRFPGSCDEVDAQLAAARVGEAVLLWHGDRDLQGADAVIVPGGFSYGDYLRVGAIARFSPVMESVMAFAREGGLVFGICNGFQVLCEAGLLPGALLPNVGLRFVCRQVGVEVANADTPFTRACAQGEVLSIPVKHTTGRYYAPADVLAEMAEHDLAAPGRYYAPADVLAEMAERGQVVLRYAHDHNPNGSSNDIAGVMNAEGNVLGLMPHPEHAVDALTGSADGLKLFESMALVRA